MRLGETSLGSGNEVTVGTGRFDDLVTKMDEILHWPVRITGYREMTGANGPYLVIAAEDMAEDHHYTITSGSAPVMRKVSEFFAKYPGETLECAFIKVVGKKGFPYNDLIDPGEIDDPSGGTSPASRAGLTPPPPPPSITESSLRAPGASPAMRQRQPAGVR